MSAHEAAVQAMATAIRDRNQHRCGVCDGRVYGDEADYATAARRALSALVASPEVRAALEVAYAEGVGWPVDVLLAALTPGSITDDGRAT